MAELVEDVNRKLVPRWRSSEVTVALGDMTLSGGNAVEALPQNDFEEKVSQWHEKETISSAAELIASAFVHGRLDDARAASDFLLRNDDTQKGLLRDLALRAISPFELADPDEDENPGHQIKWQRNILSLEPRNPFRWVDLSRNYLLIGRPKKAVRAIEAALQLAPDNRFVLRSAVRLYLHLREPDKALWLLTSSDAVFDDPMLVAPEISVSAILQKTSRLFRRAHQLLLQNNHPASQLCELAAVLATEELHHGPGRKARQLFRTSLINPDENTVAQVRWASSNDSRIDFNANHLRVRRSYEARAWSQFHLGDWDQSLLQSKAWLQDQGFSKRPAALGSFVAAVIREDHVDAIRILRKALMANPRDPLLLNNLAYSLACLGKTQEAEQAVNQITVNSEDANSSMVATLKLATGGLIEFRKGDLEAGRSLYRRAQQLAVTAGLNQAAARVLIFAAMEEIRAGADLASPEIQAALRSGERSSDHVMKVLSGRMLRIAPAK